MKFVSRKELVSWLVSYLVNWFGKEKKESRSQNEKTEISLQAQAKQSRKIEKAI
jgi:hypothetical protein